MRSQFNAWINVLHNGKDVRTHSNSNKKSGGNGLAFDLSANDSNSINNPSLNDEQTDVLYLILKRKLHFCNLWLCAMSGG